MAKRLLFVGNGVTLAHIGRPIVLARCADPARYEVHFACDARYRHWLGTLDQVWREIHTQDSASFLAALAKGKPPFSRDSLCRETEEDLALLDDIRPDLVIADFRLSMRIASTLRRIPYASITNTHWSPEFCGRYRLPDLPEIWPSRFVGARNAARIGEAILPLLLARFTQPMNQARRRFGLPAIESTLQQFYSAADHFIYAESEHDSLLSSLPSNHHYVGPVVWDPPVDLPRWWSALPDDRPLIYVCMGSSGSAAVLPSIVRGLESLPVTAVVSTAGAGRISSRSDKLFSADYLPGSLIAARATLAIGNGGSMMLQQMLSAGTPMLAIPSNMDQQMSIASLLAGNAVRELRLASVTPETVCSSVADMLADPVCRQAAKAAAQRLLACNTRTQFNRILANIVRET